MGNPKNNVQNTSIRVNIQYLGECLSGFRDFYISDQQQHHQSRPVSFRPTLFVHDLRMHCASFNIQTYVNGSPPIGFAFPRPKQNDRLARITKLTLENTTIPQVETTKFLGFHFHFCHFCGSYTYGKPVAQTAQVVPLFGLLLSHRPTYLRVYRTSLRESQFIGKFQKNSKIVTHQRNIKTSKRFIG